MCIKLKHRAQRIALAMLTTELTELAPAQHCMISQLLMSACKSQLVCLSVTACDQFGLCWHQDAAPNLLTYANQVGLLLDNGSVACSSFPVVHSNSSL